MPGREKYKSALPEKLKQLTLLVPSPLFLGMYGMGKHNTRFL